MSDHDDYEVEPITGLPERLPAGEHLVWQGQPNWWQLAITAFHIRKVGWYFLALAIWEVIVGLDAMTPLLGILMALGKLTLVAGVAMGLLALLAWGSAREAVYTLTNKRVVMRFGIALRLTLNLPFERLESASLKPLSQGRGDIALQLDEEDRISYVVLWPNARRWRFSRPEPTLRCINDAEGVAQLLANQLPAVRQAKSVPSQMQPAEATSAGATMVGVTT